MVKIFKTYSEEKQRKSPILSVDGKPMGFLSTVDKIAITCEDRQNPWRRDLGSILESVTYSCGAAMALRHFQLVHWKGELFQVSWDGPKIDPTIKATTRAAFEALITQYSHDSRWARA